jgi:hypothetical protein
MVEFKTPTRGKLRKIDGKNIEVGKNSKLAQILTLMVRLPNSALEMFDPALRTILYSAASPGEAKRKQAQIEGVDAVSDMPALTATGSAIATIPWGKEQTGCTLTIERGAGDSSAIVLPEAVAKNFKITLEEGGSIKLNFQVHAPVEHLTPVQGWALTNMHQRDVKITLVGPTVAQLAIEDDADTELPAGAKGTVVSPITALKDADRKARIGKEAAAGVN